MGEQVEVTGTRTDGGVSSWCFMPSASHEYEQDRAQPPRVGPFPRSLLMRQGGGHTRMTLIGRDLRVFEDLGSLVP